MAENNSVIDNVLNWLHQGYPEGVPPKDYFAVLALLKRSLTEEEVVKAAQTILRSNSADEPVTEAAIHCAIEQISAQAPTADEINQVAARLASVGWPLAVPAR